MTLLVCAALAVLAQPPAVSPPPSAPKPSSAPAAAGPSQGSVQLRGQVTALSGEVGAVSYGGVLLKATSDDPGRLIAWDRVRSVDGGGESVETYRKFGDALMRARARLERGDVWLADQAIDPLYQRAMEAPDERLVGPSGLLLAECALRSSLERNATAAATVAWLAWASVERQRAKPTGPQTKVVQWVGGTTNLPPVIDSATGLCPRLPPIFAHQGPNSAGMLRVLTTSPHLARLCSDKSAVRGVAAPYLLAARIAAGDVISGETATLPVPSGDAEQLVGDIVAAQTAPGDLMRAARQRLQKRLELLSRDAETKETDESDPAPDRSWQRAWLHAAIGRSLLNEDQRALRRQGLVELLHVPALDGGTQPGLAATALLDVLDELRRDNDAVGGGNDNAIAAVSAELRTRFGVEPPPAESAPLPGPTPAAPIAPAPVAPTNSSPPKESP